MCKTRATKRDLQKGFGARSPHPSQLNPSRRRRIMKRSMWRGASCKSKVGRRPTLMKTVPCG
ncbi:hypothetical protein NXC14_PA00253 (plasmid) [Rhizobium sp. NXC14]|nr:hypothetical protein NXC14_PA00253 [Rhizobium sp. NXC14]